MPTPRSTEALIKRTIAACHASGMQVARVEVSPDGTVKVFDTVEVAPLTSAQPSLAGKACDDLFGTVRSN